MKRTCNNTRAPVDPHNFRHGLTAGTLPKSCKYIELRVNRLRRTLEQAIVELKGTVSILDAAAIQSILKWERHGCLCLRWLRLAENTMKPLEKLQFSREIATASERRDKAIAQLGLDLKPQAPWINVQSEQV